MVNMAAALYIHIPFCIRKCSYCDFYSVKADDFNITQFLNMLTNEMRLYSENSSIKDFGFRTLYIGGGTPSVLSSRQIASLLDKLRDSFRLSENAEITIEVNPETVDLNRLTEYRETGINRVSIGVQSFIDDDLRVLKRIHNAATAVKCVELAHLAGFENISLDLMYAIPGQTLERWLRNIDMAVALSPNHVSFYGLTIEDGTLIQKQLRQGRYSGIAEDVEREMYLQGVDKLGKSNIRRYEVSNAALPGYECIHNAMYWDGSPYLGLGPSAHSFWNNQRQWNTSSIDTYCTVLQKSKLPVQNRETLSIEQQIMESIMLGLRREAGVDMDAFRRRFNIDFAEHCRNTIELLMAYEEPLIHIDGHQLKLTPRGFVLYDEILYKFVD
ncbi:MAG: radical SAM family heme chaperone HemW [candidate division KSB1 bacterium]|jgi:oxygen-independent coproporphyrinogen-3 oxidase|nr:radical SAM family heme chaperone HemW [candidate division KSB1 bacterium]